MDEVDRAIEEARRIWETMVESVTDELLECQFWGIVHMLPDILDITHKCLPGAHLSIRQYRDPEAFDPHYVIYVRYSEYSDRTMEVIDGARYRLCELTRDRKFDIHLTTDFQPSVDDGWIEIVSPYLDEHNDYVQVFVRRDGEDRYSVSDGDEVLDATRESLAEVVNSILVRCGLQTSGRGESQ